MKKILLVLLPFVVLACSKGKRDTTYTYYCVSSYQVDPSVVYSLDTTLYNVTDGEANAYARSRSGNGWETLCQRQ